MNKQTLFVLVIIGLIAITIGVNRYYLSTSKRIACTMEAKICPDGSSVGRTLPNCEFASCPTSAITPTTIKNDINTKGSVDCGGWDTSGEVICECGGKITKPVCPANTVCDSGSYQCEGTCGQCCYKGIAENSKYPKCNK